MGLWSVKGCAHLWRAKQPVITMIHLSPKRSGSTCLAAALVGLGLVVFLWGFAYKVSLYRPKQTQAAHILKARFYSEERDTSRSNSETRNCGDRSDVHLTRFGSAFNEFSRASSSQSDSSRGSNCLDDPPRHPFRKDAGLMPKASLRPPPIAVLC